jgi:hypothetical protein
MSRNFRCATPANWTSACRPFRQVSLECLSCNWYPVFAHSHHRRIERVQIRPHPSTPSPHASTPSCHSDQQHARRPQASQYTARACPDGLRGRHAPSIPARGWMGHVGACLWVLPLWVSDFGSEAIFGLLSMRRLRIRAKKNELAGNRTPASCLEGNDSTTELPVRTGDSRTMSRTLRFLIHSQSRNTKHILLWCVMHSTSQRRVPREGPKMCEQLRSRPESLAAPRCCCCFPR